MMPFRLQNALNPFSYDLLVLQGMIFTQELFSQKHPKKERRCLRELTTELPAKKTSKTSATWTDRKIRSSQEGTSTWF
jgi:hypothetical protein